MEVRPGYKQTEVGVIPEEWVVKSIARTAPLQRGFDLPNQDLRDGDIPVVYSNGIESFHNKSMVKGPGVVTGRSGTIGKVHYIDRDFWPHNTSLWVTRFNGNSPNFIYYLYGSIGFNRFASGSGVPTLNRNDAHSFLLAVPPPSEQNSIAEALGDVDALLSSLDRLIAKKRDIKQAAMHQLLTAQTRLPGFTAKWPKKKFADLLKYERPENYLVQSSDYEENGDTPVLTANKSFVLGYTNEDCGVFESVPAIIFDDFTTDSKYVDFPFKVKSSAIKILKVRTPDVNLRFVFERMRLMKFPLGEHKRYYISEYQHVELPTPEYAEQSAIADILSNMDIEIAALESRRDKTRALKQAMMQELLTGKTRLQ